MSDSVFTLPALGVQSLSVSSLAYLNKHMLPWWLWLSPVWQYTMLCTSRFIRSTPPSRPNNISGSQMSVRPYVRPSTKSFFDFNEIWYVGSGRRVMHDGMQYDPIQGQGHEPMKIRNSTIFKGYLLPVYNGGWQMTTDS